uniref:Uncharacterized protein n=1 Tax=Caenorhabditis japonica TaxID=281687 RepID=A0A8R1DFS9_CAEJA
MHAKFIVRLERVISVLYRVYYGFMNERQKAVNFGAKVGWSRHDFDRLRVRGVASSLGLREDTVHRHLRQSKGLPSLDNSCSHYLADQHKTIRCDLALSLLSLKLNFDSIGKIVTGYEKKCFMVNHNRER